MDHNIPNMKGWVVMTDTPVTTADVETHFELLILTRRGARNKERRTASRLCGTPAQNTFMLAFQQFSASELACTTTRALLQATVWFRQLSSQRLHFSFCHWGRSVNPEAIARRVIDRMQLRTLSGREQVLLNSERTDGNHSSYYPRFHEYTTVDAWDATGQAAAIWRLQQIMIDQHSGVTDHFHLRELCLRIISCGHVGVAVYMYDNTDSWISSEFLRIKSFHSVLVLRPSLQNPDFYRHTHQISTDRHTHTHTHHIDTHTHTHTQKRRFLWISSIFWILVSAVWGTVFTFHGKDNMFSLFRQTRIINFHRDNFHLGYYRRGSWFPSPTWYSPTGWRSRAGSHCPRTISSLLKFELGES